MTASRAPVVVWTGLTSLTLPTSLTVMGSLHACFTGLLGAVCRRYGFTSVFVSEFLDIKALLNVLMCSVYS